MAANDADDSKILKQCQYLWEEYKYRHDLIWQRLFRFTTAVVLISIIPYIQQDIVLRLGKYILIAPLLASILAGFVLIVMRNELNLFGNIKQAYRRRQNNLLDPDLQHNLDEKSYFKRFVLFYLGSLVALSVVNGLIAWLIWIPQSVRSH
ncbi:MAG: hypothetical protein GWN62_18970 [Aliifodinibius sp.]|nr:hypothetical protein [candidate division KSB1 bacterium]NIV13283.1 hypothetical protein [Fodinibius sp.]